MAYVPCSTSLPSQLHFPRAQKSRFSGTVYIVRSFYTTIYEALYILEHNGPASHTRSTQDLSSLLPPPPAVALSYPQASGLTVITSHILFKDVLSEVNHEILK